MPTKRLTAAMLLAAACFIQTCAFARVASPAAAQVCDADSLQVALLPLLNEARWLQATEAGSATVAPSTTDAAPSGATAMADASDTLTALEQAPRQSLADFAMQLRNIRYRRGGREPSTGFDCSGFVHYVFLHTLGLDLPGDAPGQFATGQKIARTQMQMGDLVFFHIRGNGISHVGIYLEDGRFIHSPSPGKSVRIDRLDDAYWTKRFVGARRLGNLG